MESIFVAQWFDKKDRELVMDVGEVLGSHGLRPVTGKVLGGDALDLGVQRKINGCDGLVALATRRDANGNVWNTHPWVSNEYVYAKAKDKPAIALVEAGVPWEGMFAGHQYIPFERDNLSEALLELSYEIGAWRRESGGTVKVQLRPDSVVDIVRGRRDDYQCKYRVLHQGDEGEWLGCKPVPVGDGLFMYIKGVDANDLIQVNILGVGGQWESGYEPIQQTMPVSLKAKGG